MSVKKSLMIALALIAAAVFIALIAFNKSRRMAGFATNIVFWGKVLDSRGNPLEDVRQCGQIQNLTQSAIDARLMNDMNVSVSLS